MLREIGDVPVSVADALVYEHGWQSWSPTAAYRLSDRPHRPATDGRRVMNYRPTLVAPADAFWGEGLLAVDPGDGTGIHIFGAGPGADPVPSVRAEVHGRRLVISANGPVTHDVESTDLDTALGRWADRYLAHRPAIELRRPPTVWCSWYHYFTGVTEADIVENLEAMADLDLKIDVVQIDDGYQLEIGDWLQLSERFSSLPAIVSRIREHGRRAGIWVAPFLVGARSRLAAEHPDWLVAGASAGSNWNQQLGALDVSHPGAADYLRTVFSTMREIGIDFFKLDFVYAGALDGRRHDRSATPIEAYRLGVRLIREAIGPDAYLLGCGAPVFPSVGLFDAMRVSPDVDPRYEPPDGDMSQPSQRAAALTGRSRAWQHGRFWVNDPDCLIVRPAVQRREDWAAHVEKYGGLRASSDRLRDLDEWGLETTRRLLVPTATAPIV